MTRHIQSAHPKAHPISLTHHELQEFHTNILNLFVANNFAIHAIESAQTDIFFTKWMPGAKLPDRRALGGRILDNAVEGSKQRTLDAVKGKMAVGISDGWKNIRNKSLLASMINVNYKAYTVRINDISAVRKTANNHLEIVKEVIEHCEKELGVQIIGWVSDAGGDSRAMRVRLYNERSDLILLDCYAHQINLIVGDIFKLKIDLITVGSESQEVAKYFLAHSFALGLLQDEQVKAGRQPRTYALANLTRWTSHYLATRSLLDDRGPLQATVALHRAEILQAGSRNLALTEKVLMIIERPEFWKKLDELNAYLQPLSIAINIAQAADTRLDHILITLGNLYCIFNSDDIDPAIRECILRSLELRWSKSDQEIFILAVFLNPYIRCRLFNPQNTTFCVAGLFTIVERAYKRLFKCEAESGLFEAFISYFNWSDEFSVENWHLDQYEIMYEKEDKNVDLLTVWAVLPFPGTINTGRHQLACLTKRILSVVANSAGAERLFSRMGNIHSKRRNRLDHRKVHDMATLAMDLEEQHRLAGISWKWRKRYFGGQPEVQPAPVLRNRDPTSSNQAASINNPNPENPELEIESDESDAEDAADDDLPVDFAGISKKPIAT